MGPQMLIPPGQTAWVVCGEGDEDLWSILHPGRSQLWADARRVGKEAGQFVLFLQLGRGPPAWIGSGAIAGVQDRWRIFGVWVDCHAVLAEPLAAIADPVPDRAGSPAEELSSWENRTLATRLGLRGFRMRTPFLEEGRDLRLTPADAARVLELQPEVLGLWSEWVDRARGAGQVPTRAP